MSICLNGYGVIILKEDTKEKFNEKFLELAKSYDGSLTADLTGDKLQFINYARHYFIDDLEELFKENIDMVVEASVCFNNTDVEADETHPMPSIVTLEVMNGSVYREYLLTRFPFEWFAYNEDGEWYANAKKQENERIDKIYEEAFSSIEVKKCEEKEHDDDLPF